MRKKISLLVMMLLLLSTVLVISGCSASTTDTEEESEQPIEVTISIDYPKKSKVTDIENIKFKIEEKSTVLQATSLYCAEAELELLVNTTDNTVHGINEVNNLEYGKNRIWKFQINGKDYHTDAEEVTLKAGDNIQWSYVE